MASGRWAVSSCVTRSIWLSDASVFPSMRSTRLPSGSSKTRRRRPGRPSRRGPCGDPPSLVLVPGDIGPALDLPHVPGRAQEQERQDRGRRRPARNRRRARGTRATSTRRRRGGRAPSRASPGFRRTGWRRTTRRAPRPSSPPSPRQEEAGGPGRDPSGSQPADATGKQAPIRIVGGSSATPTTRAPPPRTSRATSPGHGRRGRRIRAVAQEVERCGAGEREASWSGPNARAPR